MNSTVTSAVTYLLSLPAFAFIYLKIKKKDKPADICKLILLCGLILRVLYICYTSVYTRQHDVENFDLQDDGHATYILFLLYNKRFPEIDPNTCWQFYHPPLPHILSAALLWVLSKFGVPFRAAAYELLQLLPCLYSFLFCILSYKALVLLGVKDKALCYSTAFVTFHPTLILMSGSINNDMLAAMMAMASVYFTIRWSESKKLSDIVFIAFSIGFGMASKLTAGLVAPAVALVFLYVFIRNIKEFKRFILQFLIFGIICIPIGLFYPVRNYIEFGLPINFVPKLSEYSSQYIDKGVFARLLDFSPYQFSSPFIQWGGDGMPYNEFNPTIALWKTAAFDGDTFFTNSPTMQAVCVILFFSLVILSCYSAYLFIKLMIKKDSLKIEHKILIAVLSLTFYINYLVFCINFPHVCTENMRYCVPLIFTQAALFGCVKKSKPKENAIMIFCVSSLLVYTVLQLT